MSIADAWSWFKSIFSSPKYFVTYKEAAKIVGCKQEDIQNLVTWGVLGEFVHSYTMTSYVKYDQLPYLKEGKWRNYKPPVMPDLGEPPCQRPFPPMTIS